MSKTILWMTQPGMQPYVQGQHAAWRNALEQEGWTVRAQHHQPRSPWRLSTPCDWLLWTFVPTPLEVWSARLFAARQMAVVHELPARVWSQPRLDGWCVPSESMRMHLMDCGIATEKVEIVQGYASVRPIGRLNVREKLQVHAGTPLLYASGPLIPSTGNRLVIWALSILQQLRPDVCLVLHGTGNEEDRLHRFAHSVCLPGTVYLAPEDASVHALVSQADVVCLPLREDGVPDALFAALSQSKPILAMQQPSLMEWLRHDVNALLMASDRAPAWTAVLDQLLGDHTLAQRLQTAARMTSIPSERLRLPNVFHRGHQSHSLRIAA